MLSKKIAEEKSVLYPEFKSDITPLDLIEIIPGPDFPTGGIVVNQKELKNIYETGSGKMISELHQVAHFFHILLYFIGFYFVSLSVSLLPVTILFSCLSLSLSLFIWGLFLKLLDGQAYSWKIYWNVSRSFVMLNNNGISDTEIEMQSSFSLPLSRSLSLCRCSSWHAVAKTEGKIR